MNNKLEKMLEKTDPEALEMLKTIGGDFYKHMTGEYENRLEEHRYMPYVDEEGDEGVFAEVIIGRYIDDIRLEADKAKP